MKKFICFVTSFVFMVWALFADNYLISERPCEVKDVSSGSDKPLKAILSQEEMQEDLDTLCYIFDTAYAGYEEMLECGYKEEVFKQNVINHFKNQENIESRNFLKVIHEKLESYINDAHLCFSFFYDNFDFCQKKIPYWTEIYLEYKGEDLTVIQEDKENPSVKIGDLYTGNIDYIFYYPLKGENVYRLAKITYGDITEVSKEFYLSFNEKEILCRGKREGAIEQCPMKYREIESTDSVYIALNNFFTPSMNSPSRKSVDIIYRKFAKCGKKYNGKKNVILDYRSNSGGDISNSLVFYYCLYYNKDCKVFNDIKSDMGDWFYCRFPNRMVVSPLTLKTSYTRLSAANFEEDANYYYEILQEYLEDPYRRLFRSENEVPDYFSKKRKFKGKVIILIDRNSMSAGEITVLCAKEIFGEENVIVIGENSYGMASYWNLNDLELPNSKARIHVAFDKRENLDDFDTWFGEGEGVYPDWWSKGEDLNDTIFLATQDEEMKARLVNIEHSLQ